MYFILLAQTKMGPLSQVFAHHPFSRSFLFFFFFFLSQKYKETRSRIRAAEESELKFRSAIQLFCQPAAISFTEPPTNTLFVHASAEIAFQLCTWDMLNQKNGKHHPCTLCSPISKKCTYTKLA